MEIKKHSEIAPSASERWLNCSQSVTLAREAPPQPDSSAALEGTEAHAYLELWLNKIKKYRESNWLKLAHPKLKQNDNMFQAVKVAARYVAETWAYGDEELLIEEKVKLDHIHEELSGTADIILSEPYGTLRVPDYKHGKGHKVIVSRENENGRISYNTQLMIYLIGAARKFNYEFQKFFIGVIQPRASFKDQVRFAEVNLTTIKEYEIYLKRGVDRVYSKNPKLFKGDWCYFCPAREYNCPLHKQERLEKTRDYFNN